MPFKAFTITFSGRVRQIITDIVVYPAFDPAAPPNPVPVGINTKALWDTGASGSVISARLAQQLGLVPVGKAQVGHAGGTSSSLTYLVNFMLPNAVAIIGVVVTEAPIFSGFDVLLGMDVILHGDLSITHVDDKTCMSFRIPSYERIDYVKQHESIVRRLTGPNDPCPCGAKRPDGGPMKFKKCHGK